MDNPPTTLYAPNYAATATTHKCIPHAPNAVQMCVFAHAPNAENIFGMKVEMYVPANAQSAIAVSTTFLAVTAMMVVAVMLHFLTIHQ